MKRRRWVRVGLMVAAVAGAMSCVFAGRVISREDPLARADAVYVLGGTWVQRWLEAVDLYQEGLAPRIVMSPGGWDDGERALAARGVRLPGPADIARDAMTGPFHIPASAVEILPGEVDNTAQEASAIAAVAAARGWTRLIVITDRPNTRRAGFAMRRALGPGVQVIVRASRHDLYAPSRWWATRPSFRATFYEVPKLLAYWLGLGG